MNNFNQEHVYITVEQLESESSAIRNGNFSRVNIALYDIERLEIYCDVAEKKREKSCSEFSEKFHLEQRLKRVGANE